MNEFRRTKISLYWGMAINIALMSVMIGFITTPLFYLNYKNTFMSVDERSVKSHSGVLNKKTVETIISRIDAIQVEQGILGKKFDYGNIKVTSGSSVHIYKEIERPHELKTLIDERIDELAGR